MTEGVNARFSKGFLPGADGSTVAEVTDLWQPKETQMLPIYLILVATLITPAVSMAQEQDTQERQAQPRGSRSRGDNPQTGTAVPRGETPRAGDDRDGRGDRDARDNRGARDDRDGRSDNRRDRTVVVRPPAVYNYYYPNRYYDRGRSYPYGYNSFGFGYLYYDPYRSGGVYPYGPGYPSRSYNSFDIGELRLDVSPRDGQVYVDGYYAGTVDDFDGAFQALKLESGAYRLEIIAPGYDTLGFDVRINPGQKIRYRGDLIRLRP